MNLSFYIAKRYFFAKKSHNAIHIISLVTVCGVAIATMATVCTLSVFNGFQGLVAGMFSSFDPVLKITPVKGKVFDPSTEKFLEIYSLDAVDCISESLEDNALVKYKERQVPVVLKGVSDNFGEWTKISDVLVDGEFRLEDDTHDVAVLGIGVAAHLGLNVPFIFPLDIYAPRRNVPVNLSHPVSSFNIEHAYVSGVFMVKQPVYDDRYLLTPLRFARGLFDCETEVSALEINLKEGANVSAVQKKIEQIIGPEYAVKDRYRQQEAAFKMVSIEKWVTFLMLCFILLIAVFNVIGSLSMLIVDKQKDIVTLRNLGAGRRLVSGIFLLEGWMISAFGAVAGIVLGILLCLGQQHFGWLKLGNGGFAVDAYPVAVEVGDLCFVLFTVLCIGFLAALYPVRYLSSMFQKSSL